MSMIEQQDPLYFNDSFDDERPPGQVIGCSAAGAVARVGADVEGIIGIDNGALRIGPLTTPGWGRAGLTYGPYPRQAGLAMGVFMLNGHHSAQSGPLGQNVVRRVARWFLGSPGTDGAGKRLAGLWRSRHKRRMARQIGRWLRLAWLPSPDPPLDENLAVGWFPSPAPSRPLAGGNAFVVHATGAGNGALWAGVGPGHVTAVDSLQNVPIYHVVILRRQGAAYYTASLPNAAGQAGYPELQPSAIDPFDTEATLYAGVHQGVQGQIGFQADSRVYQVAVQNLPELAPWYSTAHAADRLNGRAPQHQAEAERGGRWRVHGRYLALLEPGAPSGLIHVLIKTAGSEPDAGSEPASGLLWRAAGEGSHWLLSFGAAGCQAQLHCAGKIEIVAADSKSWLETDTLNSVQILDDGETFRAHLNGRLLFGGAIRDGRLGRQSGVGVLGLGATGLWFRDFEAHPRRLPLPPALGLQPPWTVVTPKVAISDVFDGPARDLAGWTPTGAAGAWQRDLGDGVIMLDGRGAAYVRAGKSQPNPNRTFYTLSWADPGAADLEVEVTAPGSGRGEWERGRGGLVFWQDAAHYLVVNTWLDDHYDGASVSSFFYLDGFENLFDAIWTNVGDRITWGVAYRLRAQFDGRHYLVSVNDEPVLYRALTDVYPSAGRLAIRRVGLAVNWEWGNDTGSRFRDFKARRG
jgi:hypothetical protein